MKKLFISLLLMFLPIIASAEKVEIDGIWYNLITKVREAEVTYGNWDYNSYGTYNIGYSGKIDIPDSITFNGVLYHVTSIGDNAFSLREKLSSITIPNSVSSIGSNAFSNCCGLTAITIPISVTSIGSGAFAGTGLTSISIPNTITSIETATFGDCTSLTSINIPNSVTSIGINAFWGCSSLTSITIPNSVISIGINAFYNCSSLTSVTIPNSITSINNSAFYNCCSLTSVIIPNSVKTIGEQSFKGCARLNSVTIGSGVKSINNQAFANCNDLTDVYCFADEVSKDDSRNHKGLYTNPNAFMDSYQQAITLHVPAVSIEAYRSTEPWSNFKAIVPLEDGDIPEIEKCATPEISFENGKVKFTCETEDVDFISEVTVADAKKYYDSEFTLSQTYKITVYATKIGYENSDVTTREIVVEKEQTSLFGDLDKDGKVNVADHVKLSDIIMNQ